LIGKGHRVATPWGKHPVGEFSRLGPTCNQPFSEWDQVFPDPAVTVAAIDRLVHHATILEINTESYRRRTALDVTPPNSSS
jgi:hypothetical protein